ncbi:hypothetical protein [Indioceanicola profundi]|uniref:hypothetical protein n=1 Tax=Indioceanicola profundi TaxID=2220096 RepID=UPI000E6ACC36|nr:hypothetical protein [Indioceanicola profundi]
MSIVAFPKPTRAPTAEDAVRLIAEMEPLEHVRLANMLHDVMKADGRPESLLPGPGLLHFGLASLYLAADAPDVDLVRRVTASS